MSRTTGKSAGEFAAVRAILLNGIGGAIAISLYKAGILLGYSGWRVREQK